MKYHEIGLIKNAYACCCSSYICQNLEATLYLLSLLLIKKRKKEKGERKHTLYKFGIMNCSKEMENHLREFKYLPR